MRIHILGVCGTFMAGLAQILKESGHKVSGSDIQFYPPMSDYLKQISIETIKGYQADLLPDADLYSLQFGKYNHHCIKIYFYLELFL